MSDRNSRFEVGGDCSGISFCFGCLGRLIVEGEIGESDGSSLRIVDGFGGGLGVGSASQPASHRTTEVVNRAGVERLMVGPQQKRCDIGGDQSRSILIRAQNFTTASGCQSSVDVETDLVFDEFDRAIREGEVRSSWV